MIIAQLISYSVKAQTKRLKQLCKLFWLFLFALLITGCQASQPDPQLRGRITLWHSWSPEATAILDESLAEFQEIHPDVRITSIVLPEDQIYDEFLKSGENGLGPSLIIGKDSWIGEFVNRRVIIPLPPGETSSGHFNARNTALTQYQGRVYGFPLFLAPRALYYNLDLVPEPPGTLDELLSEAADGNRVAFIPRFEEAYWGIQAFGEGLFDDESRFTLLESGFLEWLTWLDEVQSIPGVILSVDDESLFELFITEQVAFYIAGPEKQALIASRLEERSPFNFGVAPIPEGPHGESGPLLPAETIMFYAYDSQEEFQISIALAAFLVNHQQSIRFMRELERVPANPRITVDRRIYPVVNGFTQQGKTAVVLPNEIPSDPLDAAGDSAYVSVLSGALTPEEAICQFGRDVADFMGYTATEISLPGECDLQKR